MLIEWTKLNRRLSELQKKRLKASRRLETDNDKAILLRPELEKLEKQLGESIAKLKTPIDKEIKKLETKKQKLVEKFAGLKKKNMGVGKSDVLEYWNRLSSKLEEIKKRQEESLEKNGLIKKWNFFEKKRQEKQRLFNKKINELRMPIMIEIGEWRIKKDGILTGKVNGSAVECDAKIQELNKKYNQNWKNVLGPINEEVYKLTAMQRNLLKGKNLLGKWDKLEERKREIEERKREIEERKREIEERKREIEDKINNSIEVKRLRLKIDKIRSELEKINQKRKKLIEPLDVEIVKIKQRLKNLEKYSKVKRWIKINKKIDDKIFFYKRYLVQNVGEQSINGLINLFENWKNNSARRIYYASWHITGLCNANCIMCEQRDVKGYRNVKFDMKFADKILKQLKKMGVIHLAFSGGEPTLVKNLTGLIKKAKDMGFTTEIFTNGYSLNKKFIKEAYEAGLDIFCISLDGSTEKINDDIRRIKSWNKIINAIRFIKENTNSEVIINTVVQKKNYKSLERLVDLLSGLNVDHVMLSQVDSFVKDNTKFRLNKNQMREFYFKILPKILKKYDSSGLKLDVIPTFTLLVGKSKKFAIKQLTKNPKKFEEEIDNFSRGYYGKVFYKKYKCYTPFRIVEIMLDGSVHPCCPTMYLDEYNMGNIKKQSLLEILNSEKFKKFREEVKEFKVDACKICRYDQEANLELNRILNK